MRLVNHHLRVIFFSQTHYLRKICHVALHREHTVGNDELHFVGSALLELFLKRLHIIVAVFQRLREAEATALYDGGMVLLVPEYIVLTAGKARHHTQIHLETGRINHHIFLADILGNPCLKLFVEIKGSIEERRSGTTGTIFLYSLNGSFFNTGIGNQTGVAIGAEHQHFLTVYDHLRFLL